MSGCDSRQALAQNLKCGIPGKTTLRVQEGVVDKSGHRGTLRPASLPVMAGCWSRLLPANLDRQSVTNRQNVRLMESKHQGTRSHTVFSQQLVARKMVGPRAVVVSIISAVCLTSLSVFLFISRT